MMSQSFSKTKTMILEQQTSNSPHKQGVVTEKLLPVNPSSDIVPLLPAKNFPPNALKYQSGCCLTTIVLPARPGKKRKLLHDTIIRAKTNVDDDESKVTLKNATHTTTKSNTPQSPIAMWKSAFAPSDQHCARYDAFSTASLRYFDAYQESHIDASLVQMVINSGGGDDDDDDDDSLQQQLHNVQPKEKLLERNQYGEGLLHILCREVEPVTQSTLKIARYLIEDVKLPLNIRNGQGQTALHLACAAQAKRVFNATATATTSDTTDEAQITSANLGWELFRMVIERAPELLTFEDFHGRTPLDYCAHEPQSVSFAFCKFLASLDLLRLAQCSQDHIAHKLLAAKPHVKMSVDETLSSSKTANILDSVNQILHIN